MHRSLEALAHITPLLDRLPIGVQLLDQELRYLYLNLVAAQHGKRAREQLLGRTISECYPGIEDTELFHRLRSTLVDRQLHELENAFDFPDGSQGWFELRLFAFAGGIVITSVDITQRKQLEVHRRHAQRMAAARQLAGGIAHDFNNLLTVVGAYTELVLQGTNLSPDQRDDLKEVLVASRRASDLGHRLFALSRHTKGSSKRLDLHDCVQGLAESLSSTLGPGISLRMSVASGLGAVEVMPTAFEQIVASLALNAKEAMNGEGRLSFVGRELELSASSYAADRSGLAPGHYIELSISDSRPTIPAAQLDNIFDPQLEEAERVGTGLSLAMCWNLVEQAGGTILVESQGGSGCTFRLLLPRLEATPAAEAPRASFPAGSAEHCVKVLVVDDEPAIRQLIVRHLHLAGHRTLEASNGVEALAQLETQPDCDLVVSDVLMPLMGGMELAQQIHERHLRPAVLFISGYAPETRSLAEGRDWPLLIKPFTKDALLRGGWQIARQYQERSHRSRRLTALLN